MVHDAESTYNSRSWSQGLRLVILGLRAANRICCKFHKTDIRREFETPQRPCPRHLSRDSTLPSAHERNAETEAAANHQPRENYSWRAQGSRILDACPASGGHLPEAAAAILRGPPRSTRVGPTLIASTSESPRSRRSPWAAWSLSFGKKVQSGGEACDASILNCGSCVEEAMRLLPRWNPLWCQLARGCCGGALFKKWFSHFLQCLYCNIIWKNIEPFIWNF